MNLLKNQFLRIPAIRGLHKSRNTLLAQRDALSNDLSACREQLAAHNPDAASPFFHYNAAFDAVAVMRRHAVPGLQAHPGYLTNFLGVLIDPKFFPSILESRAGQVEPVPIPANWHADIAEWGAALRAVDLASGRFTMVELGCGWGCWMNNTGAAARRAGLAVQLIGVEGDMGHIGFAREACETNGFRPSQVTLHHGIAAAAAGTALFPHQDSAGSSWGLEPIFNATAEQREMAVRSGRYDVLPMLSLEQVVAQHARIDLLHIDIQGSEADLVAACLSLLDQKVAYLLIGTHSRAIEGRLFDILLGAGWHLEIERPCLLHLTERAPLTHVDGVQGWRNPALLP
jgi:hypothetical protein